MHLRPLLMQGDKIAIEIWNRTCATSGEPQSEKFMMDPEKAPEMQQKAIEQAMKQFHQQSAMKAQAKGEETLAKEAAKKVVEILSAQAQVQASGAQDLMQLGQQQPPQTAGAPNGAR